MRHFLLWCRHDICFHCTAYFKTGAHGELGVGDKGRFDTETGPDGRLRASAVERASLEN